MLANGRPIKVFSGKTSRPLAEDICRELGVELSNSHALHSPLHPASR